jgi:FlaA1/EpsC-like NDP-sugar epimerase
MTIPEAVSLIVQAGSIGRSGQVFVLDMGEPVSIVELAKNMIQLSGKEPGRDIAIDFTGVRHGEKLHEELWGDGETVGETPHAKILAVTRPPTPPGSRTSSSRRLVPTARRWSLSRSSRRYGEP